MEAVLLGGIAGLGAGTWVYSKFIRSTGNNTKTSIGAAAITGGLVFLVVWSVFAIFLS